MEHMEQCIAHTMESFFMIHTGLGLIGHSIKLKRSIVATIVFAAMILGVREFYIQQHIPFGTHTFLLYIILVGTLVLIGKKRILDSMIAGLISFLLLLWGEGVFFFPLLMAFDITSETLMFQTGGVLIATILSDALLFVGFIVGCIFKKALINFNDFNENKEQG